MAATGRRVWVGVLALAHAGRERLLQYCIAGRPRAVMLHVPMLLLLVCATMAASRWSADLGPALAPFAAPQRTTVSPETVPWLLGQPTGPLFGPTLTVLFRAGSRMGVSLVALDAAIRLGSTLLLFASVAGLAWRRGAPIAALVAVAGLATMPGGVFGDVAAGTVLGLALWFAGTVLVFRGTGIVTLLLGAVSIVGALWCLPLTPLFLAVPLSAAWWASPKFNTTAI